jgi:hypothetical protein
MPKIFLGFFLLSLLLTSCKNKKQESAEVNTTTVSESKMIKSEKPISRLNAQSKKLIAPWGEYQKFDDLISQYQEISVNEALLNSVELSVLAQQLRDSIRVEKLNIPEVKIRLNVLYTQTLRLADMSTIPTITEQLVAEENNNIIEAFSALNLKINNLNAQDTLNSEISKFIDEVLEQPKTDSIKTDSIKKEEQPKNDSIVKDKQSEKIN